jgi:hypothetical protein
VRYVPDYLNDLNAMHEAEKVLSLADLVRYGGAIVSALKKSNKKNVFVAFAPAAQRAEAFLRTLALWRD